MMQEEKMKIMVRKKSAAEMLELSPRSIDYLIQAGEIPIIRVGKAVRIRVSDLENFARRRFHSTGRSKAELAGAAATGAGESDGGEANQ